RDRNVTGVQTCALPIFEPLSFPKQFVHFLVGWTGHPASTKSLVDQILALKSENEKMYEQFLSTSKEAVNAFIQGLKKKDLSQLVEGIKLNRISLAGVGKAAQAPIETSLLKVLCDLARSEERRVGKEGSWRRSVDHDR